MRHVSLYVALALVLVVSGAWAQTITIDTAIRGNTLIADPGLSGAWANNPAGLAALTGMDTKTEAFKGWRHAASATIEVSGDADIFSLDWAGTEIEKDFGLGAGFLDGWGGNIFGVGFGKSWPKQGISWGVNWRRIDPDVGDSNNIFDVGVLGQLRAFPIKGTSVVKYGVVLRDITDEFDRIWDAGLALDVIPHGVHVALDIADLSDEIDRRLKIGATKDFGSEDIWTLGVGLDDGDLTLGAVYDSGTSWQGGSWRFGAAWQDMDFGDDSLLIGALAKWGM